MYKGARLLASLLVVGTAIALIVTALNSTLIVGVLLVIVALVLGVYAQDIVEVMIDLALGLPSEPRTKKRWRP